MCGPIFKRILVGVDGSSASIGAVELAGRLAKAASAKVILMHVVKIPVMTPPECPTPLPELREALHESARQLLDRLLQHLPAEVCAEQFVSEGLAALKILQAASEWQADLIVLGTRGHGRLSHFVAGSTCEEVIHGSTCPVLVCHEPAAASEVHSDDRDVHYTLEAYAQ